MAKELTPFIVENMTIEAINEGKCGFKCSTYQDKNGKTRNSGSFVDI